MKLDFRFFRKSGMRKEQSVAILRTAYLSLFQGLTETLLF